MRVMLLRPLCQLVTECRVKHYHLCFPSFMWPCYTDRNVLCIRVFVLIKIAWVFAIIYEARSFISEIVYITTTTINFLIFPWVVWHPCILYYCPFIWLKPKWSFVTPTITRWLNHWGLWLWELPWRTLDTLPRDMTECVKKLKCRLIHFQ
jgi:hypothetical protein